MRGACSGSLLRGLSDALERPAHGVLPHRRDAVSPGAAKGPQVGAELSPIGQPRTRPGLLEHELLHHVRDRTPDQVEPDPLRPLEDDAFDGHGDIPSHGGAVRREHHAVSALEHLDVAPELSGRTGGVRRGRHVEDHVTRRRHLDGTRAELTEGAANADIERQLPPDGGANGDHGGTEQGARRAQQEPPDRGGAETSHRAMGTCIAR